MGEKMLGEYMINGFDGMARRRHERKIPFLTALIFGRNISIKISQEEWVNENLPGNMAKRYLYPETNR
jgi:hypothetical protein